MNQHSPKASGQLGFDMFLNEAEAANAALRLARETEHLPGDYADAIPFYQSLIERHNAAMLADDEATVMHLRKEACNLARKLNGGEPGILADENAPGYVIARETAAPAGSVPLWGQTGTVVVDVEGMQVRVELDGMFGIGSTAMFWPGFATRAVDFEAPFLSDTGYRSFLGVAADPMPGITPEGFVSAVIGAYVRRELAGKLKEIDPRYRKHG
ncbi:hypothetical protein T8K17_00015 [Thalassobaculum sp. OXR-137]|uniref:hypothetical protein n=1 Tax=Thalassobaculum sp. OXR-137 TaxID=3100173 RepID=UPI002AC9E13C|nr:hypothetical protein [Thalassobaculum sp. OXR-137]WPZ34531.1 hypothetical protein T8K17_00015 [Thalassobaculum sp. OXR-137]